MKSNIFQKIAVINYISILVFICAYFVPFSNTYYNNRGEYPYPVTRRFYRSIFDYYEIDSIKFLFFIAVPTLVFVFLYKYLATMNKLEMNVYRQKGKFELIVLLVFLSVVFASILLSYGAEVLFDFIFLTDVFGFGDYVGAQIKSNVVFVFLISFSLLYIVRPLLSVFKRMIKEVV